MRISSVQIFNIANNSISDANEAIAKTQAQLSTGQRVLKPSDDPVASIKVLEIEQNLARLDQYGKNIDIAKNNLSLEETALDSVSNLLQRVREIAVQAGNNATYTSGDYDALAVEVDARLEELKNLLNTRNAGGDFIFAGYKGGEQPFGGTASSGFSYSGTDGQVNIKISDSTSVATSDSGKSIFMDVPAAQNSFNTSVNPANSSDPAAMISVGRVTDQDAYDEFYPEDMIISFGHDAQINPPGTNLTIRERSTGNVIQPFQNAPYNLGETLEVNGLSFEIAGKPDTGTTLSPATINFGAVGVVDFSLPLNTTTVDITVGAVTETFVLNQSVTNAADLANLLNDAGNGNAARLANLGVSASAAGLVMPAGVNLSISGGNANTDSAFGLATSTGVTSTDGAIAEGDQFFVDSSPNQDVLTTLARFSQAMRDIDGSQESKDQLSAIVADTLDNMNNAQTNILETTSSLGARVNTLESTQQQHTDTDLVSREVMSELRDLDYAEAASRLSAQTLVLEAAQATFVRISQLSLFSRL